MADPTPAERPQVAHNLAERQPGQLVRIDPLPGEHWILHAYRAALVNEALLFGDMLRGEYR